MDKKFKVAITLLAAGAFVAAAAFAAAHIRRNESQDQAQETLFPVRPEETEENREDETVSISEKYGEIEGIEKPDSLGKVKLADLKKIEITMDQSLDEAGTVSDSDLDAYVKDYMGKSALPEDREDLLILVRSSREDEWLREASKKIWERISEESTVEVSDEAVAWKAEEYIRNDMEHYEDSSDIDAALAAYGIDLAEYEDIIREFAVEDATAEALTEAAADKLGIKRLEGENVADLRLRISKELLDSGAVKVLPGGQN